MDDLLCVKSFFSLFSFSFFILQCNNRRDESKNKPQLQYQSYAANLQPGGELNYSLNTPLGQQVSLIGLFLFPVCLLVYIGVFFPSKFPEHFDSLLRRFTGI